MKDFTREQLEAHRPSLEPSEAIEFVLETLYKDDTRTVSEDVVRGLSFEELIGALLLARDDIDSEDRLAE